MCVEELDIPTKYYKLIIGKAGANDIRFVRGREWERVCTNIVHILSIHIYEYGFYGVRLGAEEQQCSTKRYRAKVLELEDTRYIN